MVAQALPPTASQVSKEAYDAVIDMTVPIGGVISARDLLEAVKLPRPWPELVERMARISDELDCRVQVEPFKTKTRQWNPVSGRWPFDTTDLFDASGRLSVFAIRAVPTAMRTRAEVMYRVVHETAHMMIVELGLRGLFHREPDLVHANVFGELFAEYVSHYELGVAAHGYWSERWRPAAEAIGQAVNAGQAAVHAGLTTPKERAQLAASAYYEKIQPRIAPERLRADVELLAAWTMQRQYAAKSWRACKMWEEQYWGHPAIRQYLHDFVPDTPAEVWLQGRAEPLRLESVRQALECTPILLGHWTAPPPELGHGLSARRAVQRAALAVCQLLRVVDFPDLQASGGVRAELREAILGARGELEDLFHAIPRSSTEEQRDHVRAEAGRVQARLTRKLKRITRGAGLRYLHPACHGLSMHDPQIDLRPLGTLRWPRRRAHREQLLSGLRLALDRIVVDLTAEKVQGTTTRATERRMREVWQLKLESRMVGPSTPDADGRAFIERVNGWYTSCLAERSLVLTYPIEWNERYPFVDPLVGYFIQ